jgi:hypothetical protein
MGNHRLHRVAITVSPKRVTVITLVGHDVVAAFDRTTDRSRQMNTFHYGYKPLRIALLTRRQLKCLGVPMTVANQVDLGGQAAPTAPQRMVYRLLRAPFTAS